MTFARYRLDASNVVEIQTEARCVALDQCVVAVELIADRDAMHERSAENRAVYKHRLRDVQIDLRWCHVVRCSFERVEVVVFARVNCDALSFERRESIVRARLDRLPTTCDP